MKALPAIGIHAMRTARIDLPTARLRLWLNVSRAQMQLDQLKMTTMKWQKFPPKGLSYTCKFDFEVGYLVRSPCRACEQIEKLPACSRACSHLERVQSILADSISCTRRR